MDVHVCGDGTLAQAILFGLTQHSSKFHFVPADKAQILWCAWDTPIDSTSVALSDQVIAKLGWELDHLSEPAIVVLSSQLPVGTCASLERDYPEQHFAVMPENVRASHNIQDWLHQDRIVIGTRREMDEPILYRLVEEFTDEILFMSPESAEMVKHALNGFLALSIAYINEIATLCEHVNADVNDVSRGLMSDHRIGPGACLRPGGPFDSGHLERELNNLSRISTPEQRILIDSIARSNTQQVWRSSPERSIVKGYSY